MNINPTLSVIIPVYNAEPYLRSCLDSILNQTFKDYEIIAINDGSSDGSLEILNAYANAQDNIRVINQPNSGVSKARNAGIESARGKFITFIDSDDVIRPEYLSNFQYVDTYGWQIQGFELNYIGNEADNKLVHPIRTGECTLKEAIEESELKRLSRGPYIKLFLSSVIRENSIRFDERLSYGEDAIFVKEYLLHCNTMVFSIARTDYIYNHYQGSTSLVHRYHDPRLKYLATKTDYNLFLRLQDRLGHFSQKVLFDFRKERALEMYNEFIAVLSDSNIEKGSKIMFCAQMQSGLFAELQDVKKLPITHRVVKFCLKYFSAKTCVKILSFLPTHT